MVYDIGTPAEHRMRHRPVNECATEQLIGPALTTQIERGAGSHSALGFAKFVRPELPGGIKASGIRPRICYLFHVFKNTTSGKIPRPHKNQLSDRDEMLTRLGQPTTNEYGGRNFDHINEPVAGQELPNILRHIFFHKEN